MLQALFTVESQRQLRPLLYGYLVVRQFEVFPLYDNVVESSTYTNKSSRRAVFEQANAPFAEGLDLALQRG